MKRYISRVKRNKVFNLLLSGRPAAKRSLFSLPLFFIALSFIIMHYYLGIDIGTTAVKAVAFSPEGTLLKTYSQAYPMYHPQPDRSEQKPEEILEAVVRVIRQTVQALHPALPGFLSFSAAMHSLVAMDDNGGALTPLLIWADNRAAAIADELRNTSTGQEFYALTGTPVHAMSQFCKLLWLKKESPEIFKAAAKFTGIKEYVFFKLFGSYITDTSIASATGLLNTRTLQWETKILSYLTLQTDRLPSLVAPTYHFHCSAAARQLQLPESTLIVAGGNDGGLANLGAGSVNSDTLTITVGTSSAVRLTVQAPQTDSAMRTFCYHIRDNQYVIGGAGNNGGVVLEWIKEQILATTDTYEHLMQEAAGVLPGCNGLLFLPYILGERAPLWDTVAKGVFFGLTINHSRAHLVRAALEGIIFSIYNMAAVLLQNWPVQGLLATGGFAQNALWVQLLADVFGKRVTVSNTIESSALGAVMIGAAATGSAFTLPEQPAAVYEPDTAAHEIYKARFEQFVRLYKLLKSEMKN